jgi:hypothetical protein
MNFFSRKKKLKISKMGFYGTKSTHFWTLAKVKVQKNIFFFFLQKKFFVNFETRAFFFEN